MGDSDTEPDVDPCPTLKCDHDAELHTVEHCTYCEKEDAWFKCDLCDGYCGTCDCPGANQSDCIEPMTSLLHLSMGKRERHSERHHIDICSHKYVSRRRRPKLSLLPPILQTALLENSQVTGQLHKLDPGKSTEASKSKLPLPVRIMPVNCLSADSKSCQL